MDVKGSFMLSKGVRDSEFFSFILNIKLDYENVFTPRAPLQGPKASSVFKTFARVGYQCLENFCREVRIDNIFSNLMRCGDQ